MRTWFTLSVLVGAGLLLALRADEAAIAGFNHAQAAGIVALAALLLALGGAVARQGPGRMERALHSVIGTAALGFALVASYSYRDDASPIVERVAADLAPVVERVAGDLLPGTPVTVESDRPDGQGVRIRRHGGGHFIARAHVNGAPVRMIVDTGATTVVLRNEDAESMGIDVSGLTYSVPVQTANGLSYAARLRLDEVAVGPLALRGVDAMIARPGALHRSLLGMSFLSRLRSYEFSGNVLILRT